MSGDVGAVVALTDAEESRMFFALFEPDDDCAHNVAPLYAEVERIIAVRVEAAKAEALREAADWLDQDETFPPPDKHDGWWRDGWECGVVDACDALRNRAAALDPGPRP